MAHEPEEETTRFDREVAIVATRLTDKQKKKIVADYLENGSYRATGRQNGVSGATVKRIVCECNDFEQKYAEKMEQNTLDMLAYMDSRKEQAQSVIDKYLAALADPEKLKDATLSQIATALGIVVDKFTKGADALTGDKADKVRVIIDV